MATKRRLHHWLVVIRRVSLWQLILVFAIFFWLSIYFLRQNNLEMVARRNLVIMADQQGGDISTALKNLQQYVMGHMNTSMGDKGVYLTHTYQNAYNQSVQQAESADAQNSAIYEQADHECQQLFSKTASFSGYVQCVTDKVSSSGTGQDPLSQAKVPSADLFRYDFISPGWSPDTAGLSVLITVVLALLIACRLLLIWFFRLQLHRRA